MTNQDFKKIEQKLPDLPGVYFFLGPKIGTKKEILYIGKATSLRDRVKSYFNDDLMVTRGPLVQAMIAQTSEVDFQVTDSVLEALILETNLIKKYQPKANTKEKDDKSFNHIIITKEKFPQVLMVRGKNIVVDNVKYDFGPYTNGAQLKEALRIVRKIFPFRDARCVPADTQIAKGRTPRPCFNRQIGLCPGVCTGEISARNYGRIINHLRLFFEGKKTQLVRQLEKEMAQFAKSQEFEQASKIKHTLFALGHIQDVSLIKGSFENASYQEKAPTEGADSNKNIFRIEAYDIAHLSGKNMVGAMVVLENGEPNKAEYRKFKIRTINQSNDVGALREVLKRRFAHRQWRMPDVVAVDGNDVQKKAAEEVLSATNIAVVAVVKNEHHKPRSLIGKPEIIDKYEREILLANHEAHRFVIAYHKKLRSDFLR